MSSRNAGYLVNINHQNASHVSEVPQRQTADLVLPGLQPIDAGLLPCWNCVELSEARDRSRDFEFVAAWW